MLLHEYYLEKLKQKEEEKVRAIKKLKDEIQYQLKKKIDLKKSINPAEYLEKFRIISKDEDNSH